MGTIDGIISASSRPPAAAARVFAARRAPRVRVAHTRMVRRARRLSLPPSGARRFVSLLRNAQHQTILAAVTLLVMASFSGGVWFAETTPRIGAEEPAVSSAAEAPPSGMHAIPLATVTPESLQPPEISNDLLFNTRLEDLQEYLSAVDQAAASSTRAEFMANRREKLKAYLTDMRSPFLSEADTIAEQPHWKLILAISFAESTLGKRCYMYNCSGIGGSNIKTYDSLQSWIEDFNDLLERRYKDKTLEQMCGVYVQPCNPNWLLATKQVLTDLKERGIE